MKLLILEVLSKSTALNQTQSDRTDENKRLSYMIRHW